MNINICYICTLTHNVYRVHLCRCVSSEREIAAELAAGWAEETHLSNGPESRPRATGSRVSALANQRAAWCY